MMKTPGILVAVALATIALTACGNDADLNEIQQQSQDINAADQAQIAATQAKLQAMVEEERQTAHAGKLPKDYKSQIDARFAQTLIDPDSRQIEDLTFPYGGLVCGYINAKNRLGGYTGREPFYAIFSSNGELFRLTQFSPDELAGSHGDLGAVTDCGF